MKSYTDVNEILDAVKDHYSLTSDGQIAKKLNVSRTRISNWRCGKNTIDDDVANLIENLLKLPKGVISLEMHAQRTKCPAVSNTFHQLAKKIAAGALCLMLGFNTFISPNLAEASQNVRFDNNIHYAHIDKLKRRRRKQSNCLTRTCNRFFQIIIHNLKLTINDKNKMIIGIIIINKGKLSHELF